MVTKDDWVEWLDSPVTKEFKKEVTETIEIIATRILNRTYMDAHTADLWDKGFIKGVQELLTWRPESSDDL